MADENELDQETPGDDPIVTEAKKRFKLCADWERHARRNWLNDYKFAHGDSYNMYQWPSEVIEMRGGPETDKPTLTINKVRQHNLQIKNEAKQNKAGMSFRPVGNSATKESAQIWNGLARHIENQSNATAHYNESVGYMVDAGFGYWRVKTDYASDKNFDQEIYICGLSDPLGVMLDCDAKEPDKSDARYGFISEDCPKDLVGLKWPQYKDQIGAANFLGQDEYGWVKENQVRVSEYYRRVEKRDKLFAYQPDPLKPPIFLKESELAGDLKEVVQASVASGATKVRSILGHRVEWHFIIGNKIVETREWPGSIIPIVPCVAEELIIEGKLDRPGHTRSLLDPQRMYNYWSSSAVEYGALQTKTPWIASEEAIGEYTADWNNANVNNKSVLLYNALADDGVTPIPKPERIQPPVAAPVALQGMQTAAQELMLASGQYQASMGAQGNERSGKAIQERQRQGDNATYHYIDAQGIAIRKTAKIIKEIAPRIYDTQRVIQILQEDGKSLEVMIDPKAKKAYEETQDEITGALKRIFNPAIGDFEVTCDVGPSYGTKREEAFQAFTMLLGQAPQLIPILGDILLKTADFPMSEEASDRLQRMVPPQALGTGPSPAEQGLMQKVQSLTAMLGKLMEEKAKLDITLKGKDQQKVIDLMNAFTARLKVLGDQALSQSDLKELVSQVVQESLGLPLEAAAQASEPDLAAAGAAGGQQLNLPLNAPPQPGARLGDDGQWYSHHFAGNSSYRPVGGGQ